MSGERVTNRGYHRLVVLTAFLAFVVVILGAYTRLSDAGLGCPDWPGCYGRLIVPAGEHEVADKAYLEQRPLEPHKGWYEMIHRYFAGTLGLAILAIAVWSWVRRREPGQPVWLPLSLFGLVVFQALLGMWTVTLQLKPVVVMAHLLGGMSTLALLVLLALRTSPRRRLAAPPAAARRRWRGFAAAALLVLVGQIALGGWTSANYAALACPDFPTCQGSWWPDADFREGFVLWRGLGVNYEFGVLDSRARTAVHLTHRVGAVVTLLVLGALALGLIRTRTGPLATTGWLVGGLLIAQILLGIGNVVMFLPLGVAVAHNATAALLLLSLVRLNFQLWQRQH
ncbi:MAG: COX15/CtaA family protein [Gammaproteobacteria bacterium]|jgi:cytochrome c oxidase assembly protein subunit 15